MIATQHFRLLSAFVSGVALSVAVGVFAQSGYPTRIRALVITLTGAVGNSGPNIDVANANPTVHLRETDATADNRIWTYNARSDDLQRGVINDANSNGSVYETVTRTGIVVDSIAWAATAATINGVAITPSDGSMSSSTGTGWAAMPTLSGSLSRRGSLVFFQIPDATVQGTSNATTTQFTAAIPVGFRPSGNRCVTVVPAVDNSVSVTGQVAMWIEADGDVEFIRTTTGVCGSGGTGWTASGAKQIRAFNGFYGM